MKLSSVLLIAHARGTAVDFEEKPGSVSSVGGGGSFVGWEDIPFAGDLVGDFEEKPDMTDERTLGAGGSVSSVGGGGNLIGWYDIPAQVGASVSFAHGGSIGGSIGAQKVDPWEDLHKLYRTFGSSQCAGSVMAKRNRDDCWDECEQVIDSGKKLYSSSNLSIQ